MADAVPQPKRVDGQGSYVVQRVLARGGEGELFAGRWWTDGADGDDGWPVVLKRRVDSDHNRVCWDSEREMLVHLAGAVPGGAPELRAAWEETVPGHEESHYLWLAVELIPGAVDRDAGASTLWEMAQPEGMRDLAAVSTLVEAVGRRLTDFHRAGVIHGDVHPANILVAGDGRIV